MKEGGEILTDTHRKTLRLEAVGTRTDHLQGTAIQKEVHLDGDDLLNHHLHHHAQIDLPR